MTSPIDFDEGIAIEAGPSAFEAAPSAGLHLKLSIDDVISCVDDSNSLYVYGAAGDSVEIVGGWTAIGLETVEGAVFNVYAQDGVFLKVACDIDQSVIDLA